MTFEQAMIYTLTKENDKLQIEIGRLRQALEQQSCEDCVSRQAVIDTITQWIKNRSIETFGSLRIKLDNLPPVIPTRKQGEWDEWCGFPYGAYWKCSCCNELIKVRYPMNFCPNCGADMRGAENE